MRPKGAAEGLLLAVAEQRESARVVSFGLGEGQSLERLITGLLVDLDRSLPLARLLPEPRSLGGVGARLAVERQRQLPGQLPLAVRAEQLQGSQADAIVVAGELLSCALAQQALAEQLRDRFRGQLGAPHRGGEHVRPARLAGQRHQREQGAALRVERVHARAQRVVEAGCAEAQIAGLGAGHELAQKQRMALALVHQLTHELGGECVTHQLRGEHRGVVLGQARE
jgi:hypothetical protein